MGNAVVVAFLLMLACMSPSLAQTVPSVIAPLTVAPDHNGVNITTGLITFHGPMISIPAAPRLTFDYVQNAAPYYVDTASSTPDSLRQDSISVHYGGPSSESFQCVDFDCNSVDGYGAVSGTGSTILPTEGGRASYQRAPSGEIYDFDQLSTSVCTPGSCHYLSYASTVNYPDGEILTYSYDTVVYNGVTYYRPNRISSNIGYFLTIAYGTGAFGTQAWGSPTLVGIYSAADPGTPLQTLSYGANGAITDIAGRGWTCQACQGGMGSPIETKAGSEQLPTESTVARQVTVFNSTVVNLVGTVTNDGIPWSYAYQNVGTNG
jgi:hypothetical protein